MNSTKTIPIFIGNKKLSEATSVRFELVEKAYPRAGIKEIVTNVKGVVEFDELIEWELEHIDKTVDRPFGGMILRGIIGNYTVRKWVPFEWSGELYAPDWRDATKVAFKAAVKLIAEHFAERLSLTHQTIDVEL